MGNGTKVAIGMMLIFIVIVGGGISYAFSAKFTANGHENSVFAQDESMQNTWAMRQQQMKMGGVTVKNYGETFIKSLQANAERYKNDKGAMMKWVQEAKSQMSPDLHKQFMTTIEKVYAAKEARQLSKISVVQNYRDFLTTGIKGQVAQMMGTYPSAKAQIIMDRIISTKEVKETWKTGEDSAPTDVFN